MDRRRPEADTECSEQGYIREGGTMSRLGKALAVVCILGTVPITALAASGTATLAGSWRTLSPAPFPVRQGLTSVWTGRQLVVFGRNPLTNPSANVAEAYAPASGRWSRLAPPALPGSDPGCCRSVWTGRQMLVFGAFRSLTYMPSGNRWQALQRSIPTGIVVWTGHEAIGWGGGCCGDARSNGVAYNPLTRVYRPLSRSPLAPSQRPLGAWTGHELLLFVSGFDPDGRPYPARFARAAAYDPATNMWRRIAPLPGTGLRFAGAGVWDGHEFLVAGAGADGKSVLAYDPKTNLWRRLAPLPAPRVGATALWTGAGLVLWGGQNLGASRSLSDGLAYDPTSDRWSSIAPAPIKARSGSAVAWTGRSLLVWGGEIGTPAGTSLPPRFPRDGAGFTPAASQLVEAGCGG
ncbi:MAG: hypothetical protein C5B48_09565 [Candidatus Rokuibacteriota bacterium]|nr:MAG: hypothetical protein C5B48_09565 [Candidatus Rokubacteria bacterium]